MPNRRQILMSLVSLFGLSALAALFWRKSSQVSSGGTVIKNSFSLDFQWPTQEPFLFCAHHYDFYPAGTEAFGPEESLLEGRNMGQDFEIKDGFRMYHGEVIPGFPVHPHRGFETITIVRKGLVDHADSLGAAGRYGEGDVQWMTAGAGVQHSEMFPLLHKDQKNTLELFQIWLNLPKKSKMVEPHFKMFWSGEIPRVNLENGAGSVTVIAGDYAGVKALPPPPDSWAGEPEHEVSVLLVKMQKDAVFNLPRTKESASRTIYFFVGSGLEVNGQAVSENTGLHLDSLEDLQVVAKDNEVEFLILQARPIGEPTAQYGPFVMNTREELIRTVEDYQKTQFGGWPWERHDMVHGPKIERFAKYPDGTIEKPKS